MKQFWQKCYNFATQFYYTANEYYEKEYRRFKCRRYR
jgi:hypothetical protein